jgi:hypothetical protein
MDKWRMGERNGEATCRLKLMGSPSASPSWFAATVGDPPNCG